MNTILFAVCSVLAFASVATAKPSVGSVSVVQDGLGRIAVTYSLSGDEPGIVTVGFTCAGEPVPAKACRYVWGDVNRVIRPDGEKHIWWDAKRDWPGHDALDGTLKAVVTVWDVSAPPMYMEINLLQKNSIAYYASEDAVPFGLTADVYKTDRMLFRRIYAKGVTWRMGSPSGEAGRESGEAPFLATFSSDYYIGVYPVTQRQFFNFYYTSGISVVSSQPSQFTRARGYADADMRPVEKILYTSLRGEKRNGSVTGCVWPKDGHDVTSGSIIGKFRSMTGLELLDLPTSAQWEYACRAGEPGALYLKDAELEELGWFEGNSPVDGEAQTHPVGLKKPNAWGLYDMYGNVMEWCLDRYGTYPKAEVEPYVDWGGIDAADSENVRVRRGGCYDKPAGQCRSAAVWHQFSVECGDPNLGFRLCCPAQ